MTFTRTSETLRSQHEAHRLESVTAIDRAEAARRDLTPEESQANDERAREMNFLETHIREHERFSAMQLPSPVPTAQTPTPPPSPIAPVTARPPVIAHTRAAIRQAFNAWATTGNVPAAFANVIPTENAAAQVPPVLAEVDPTPYAANVFRFALELTGTRPLQTSVPTTLNLPLMQTFAGGPLAENAVVPGTPDNNFSTTESLSLQGRPYHSGIAWLSISKLLMADTFDLAGYLQQDLRYIKELGVEKDIISTIGADAGVTRSVVATSASGPTYQDIVTLIRSLPDLYDRLKVVVLCRPAFDLLESNVDSDGHPIIKRDDDYPDILRVNGVPVLKSTSFPTFAVNSLIGIVVSMVGFRFRDAAPEKVIRYANWAKAPDQIGFDAVGYHGFDYAKSAVAKLKASAFA